MPADVSSRIPPPLWFQHFLPIELPLPEVDVVSAEPPVHAQPSPPSPREFGFGTLSAICNPELVDRVLAECGRLERSCRLLPARLMVYALLLMCLYPGLGYQKPMHHLAEAAPRPCRWPIPNKSSFSRAPAGATGAPKVRPEQGGASAAAGQPGWRAHVPSPGRRRPSCRDSGPILGQRR